MSLESRKIKKIIEPKMVIEGAGVQLLRSFGPARSNNFDPFLLFDHFAFNNPEEGLPAGFPNHPHRGIETVTYMLEGNVRHRDSLGNQGIIGPGDVQWMTSGSGIMHEEMPKRGESRIINGFQLWVNLPAAEKMSKPRYQEVIADSIPIVDFYGSSIRVIAGVFEGVRGPVTEIAIKPLYLDVKLNANLDIKLPVNHSHNAVVYVFQGGGFFGERGESNDEVVQAVRMVVLSQGDFLPVKAGKDGLRFMLMMGEAIQEPIVPYGPFVLNTEEEIRQAFHDLRNGTFVKEIFD